MVKPHFANYENIVELVKSEITKKGMNIEDSSYIKYSVEDAQKHYAEHFRGSYENAKGFYKELENYITSDKAYGMIVSGEDAITTMRTLIKELRQTIPAMIGEEPRMTENVLHGSDCEESVLNEIAIFNSLKK
jgi:nucleoside-diphosphate kinase